MPKTVNVGKNMSYDTAMQKKVGLTLWTSMLIFSSAMQFWRAAIVDGIIYILAAVMCLLLEIKSVESFLSSLKIRITYKFRIIFIVVFIELALVRIHTLPALVGFLLLLPVLVMVEPPKLPDVNNEKAFKRSKTILIALAFAFGLTEIISLVVTLTGINETDFPTVSLLLDPTLHTTAGRVLLLIPYFLVGYVLVFPKEKS